MYPEEILGIDDDDGTMVASRDNLAEAVVGHKIVNAKMIGDHADLWYYRQGFEITLDTGRKVRMYGQSDCCAYTDISKFMLNVENIDHIITGVGTTDGFTTWHIYADMGDVLEMEVGWSCGNPFYYAYGFHIEVVDSE